MGDALAAPYSGPPAITGPYIAIDGEIITSNLIIAPTGTLTIPDGVTLSMVGTGIFLFNQGTINVDGTLIFENTGDGSFWSICRIYCNVTYNGRSS